MRPITSRPTYVVVVEGGDQELERRLRVVGGRRHGVEDLLEERREVGLLTAGLAARRALPGVGVEDRELELLLGGVEVDEEVVDLVEHLGGRGVGAVDLVDDHDRRQPGFERLAQHEAGLRQRAFGGVDQEQHAVDHLEDALDLAAEVGVARGVDDVDPGVAPGDGGVLRQDGDAVLALEVDRVHDALDDRLVLAEGAGLPEHGVDERGLAVVDVGDDGEVSQVRADGGGRGGSGLGRGAHRDVLGERATGRSGTPLSEPPPRAGHSLMPPGSARLAGLIAAHHQPQRRHLVLRQGLPPPPARPLLDRLARIAHRGHELALAVEDVRPALLAQHHERALRVSSRTFSSFACARSVDAMRVGRSPWSWRSSAWRVRRSRARRPFSSRRASPLSSPSIRASTWVSSFSASRASASAASAFAAAFPDPFRPRLSFAAPGRGRARSRRARSAPSARRRSTGPRPYGRTGARRARRPDPAQHVQPAVAAGCPGGRDETTWNVTASGTPWPRSSPGPVPARRHLAVQPVVRRLVLVDVQQARRQLPRPAPCTATVGRRCRPRRGRPPRVARAPPATAGNRGSAACPTGRSRRRSRVPTAAPSARTRRRRSAGSRRAPAGTRPVVDEPVDPLGQVPDAPPPPAHLAGVRWRAGAPGTGPAPPGRRPPGGPGGAGAAAPGPPPPGAPGPAAPARRRSSSSPLRGFRGRLVAMAPPHTTALGGPSRGRLADPVSRPW